MGSTENELKLEKKDKNKLQSGENITDPNLKSKFWKSFVMTGIWNSDWEEINKQDQVICK